MTISREQSSAMRGIAILGIVLHNYLHWLRPMVKENEYQFYQHNANRMVFELVSPNIDTWANMISFFGHYGVPVFVFLSAYGLVMKYEKSVTQNSPWSFFSSHYRKLFLMMIVGYSAFLLIDNITPGARHYTFWNVIGQLGMFSNLYENPDKAIWPGPYWYFGLMVQIYLAYRLFFYKGEKSMWNIVPKKWENGILISVAALFLFLQLLFPPMSEALEWYRYNLFGALPVFLLALLFARKVSATRVPWMVSKPTHMAVTIISCVLAIYFSTMFVTWIFVPFLICIGTYCFVKCLPELLLKGFSWIGTISAAMFVCHPITRKIIIPISHRGDILTGTLIYLITTIMLSLLFKQLIEVVIKRK